MEEQEVLVDLFRDMLGKEKQYYPSKGQIAFNCYVCDEGRNKGNLEVNIFQHVFKCWSCCEINGTQGALGKLVDIVGNKKQKKIYNVFKPVEVQKEKRERVSLKLPKEYTSFDDYNPLHVPHKQAKNYLASRGINDEIIKKYKIGFACEGEYNGRIIVPSFDKEGELNFFVSRAWFKTKSKYKNPQAPKELIIFNESLINWNEPIFLCEGVFDSFFLPNSIPLLGKVLPELLFTELYEKSKNDIIICLDGDAWDNAKRIYNQLNGGKLGGKIKILKLPTDKDVCDLKGDINNFYYKMNY
jgi:DNA primase